MSEGDGFVGQYLQYDLKVHVVGVVFSRVFL